MNPSQRSELTFWEVTLHIHKLVNEHRRLVGSLTFEVLRSQKTQQQSDYILVMIYRDCRVMRDLSERNFRLLVSQIPLHQSMKGFRLGERQGKYPHVGKEEVMLSKTMEPFLAAVKHRPCILIHGVSK